MLSLSITLQRSSSDFCNAIVFFEDREFYSSPIMKGNQKNYTISRSEKKRRAKNVENLALELAKLPRAAIQAMDLPDELVENISSLASLKTGSLKRQLKFIAKLLRQIDSEPIYAFLEANKGSKLRETKNFHVLERLRDDFIGDAFEHMEENETFFETKWQSPALTEILRLFPSLDEHELRLLAERFFRTRKPTHKREIFRLLKAAQEQQRFQQSATPTRD